MPSLCFLIPAFRRYSLTRICLRQLKRTCEALGPEIVATAVVVADDANLDSASQLGFETVECDNDFLGRKWNAGFEWAARQGFDYLVPFGSDNVIDPAIIADHLPTERIVVYSSFAVVREDGDRIAEMTITTYKRGVGIRIYPTAKLTDCGYRPMPDDKQRALDTATLETLKRLNGGHVPRWYDAGIKPLQMVEFTSPYVQIGGYTKLYGAFGIRELEQPLAVLAKDYPGALISDMKALYARRRESAALFDELA